MFLIQNIITEIASQFIQLLNVTLNSGMVQISVKKSWVVPICKVEYTRIYTVMVQLEAHLTTKFDI